MKEEFNKALGDLKSLKVAVKDKIQVGTYDVYKLFELIRDIYRTTYLPTDFIQIIT